MQNVRDNDLALAKRAAQGDRSSLHALVDRHCKPLYRTALGLCPTQADAEDVLQETLLAAFRGIGGFSGQASLLTWMTRILVRQAAKVGKKRRRRKLESIEEIAPSDPRLPLSRQTLDEDGRLDFAAALRKLAREHREVVVLREVQGLSYTEIAELLGIAQGTVESRIHRARLELRQHLRAYASPPAR